MKQCEICKQEVKQLYVRHTRYTFAGNEKRCRNCITNNEFINHYWGKVK